MFPDDRPLRHDGRPVDPAAIALLRCPHCSRELAAAPPPTGRSALRCPAGHAFDVARQGYVNLLAGPSPHAGDTAAMVAARADALSRGALDAVTRGLVAAVEAARPAGGPVVDVGAGTGHHTARVLDAAPDAVGVALDVSVYAARRAARAHPRLASVVCDAWSPLPVRDGVAGVVLSVFAPRNPAEAARVLRPDGALVVVTPTVEHLSELVEALDLVRVDPDKDARLAASLAGSLEPSAVATVREVVTVGRAEATSLVAMGPSAHHLDEHELARRASSLPEQLEITVSVQVSTHRRRGTR